MLWRDSILHEKCRVCGILQCLSVATNCSKMTMYITVVIICCRKNEPMMILLYDASKQSLLGKAVVVLDTNAGSQFPKTAKFAYRHSLENYSWGSTRIWLFPFTDKHIYVCHCVYVCVIQIGYQFNVGFLTPFYWNWT